MCAAHFISCALLITQVAEAGAVAAEQEDLLLGVEVRGKQGGLSMGRMRTRA